MQQAGMFGPSIAFNQHAPMPLEVAVRRYTALHFDAEGKATAEGVARAEAFETEYNDNRRQNRNAAKRSRKANAAKFHGPHQPAPAKRRTRTAIRMLQRAGRKALTRGDAGAIRKIAAELGALLTASRIGAR
jgi:hypothetical protein